MTDNPVSGQIRIGTGASHTSSRLASWAVGIAAVVLTLDVLSGAIFAVAYAREGSAGISDNWVGFLSAVALLGGLLVSPIAFVMAITAKIKHEKWVWLWFPLFLFPVLLAFVVFGEVFWWE